MPPVYGRSVRTRRVNSVIVPEGTLVIQDSGAFSDGCGSRLSFGGAEQRQITHAGTYGYAGQITHRASYDVLIDEKWENGRRVKSRWSKSDADSAVDETVLAAQYLRENNTEDVGLILSVQGVTKEQYLGCAGRIIPMIDTNRDILGLGGWCIVGVKPNSMLPVFASVVPDLVSMAASAGIVRIHIWGVIYPRALGLLLWHCDQHGITLSTDSASPNWRPAFGMWGYDDWIDKEYERPGLAERGSERARHVLATSEWLNGLDRSRHYTGELYD